MRRAGGRAGFLLALVALSLAASVLVARLPPDLDGAVVTRRHHNSDPLLSAALLRFDVQSLLHAPTRYFQPPFLYPDENPMRGTEPLVAEALLALPFRLALGDRPAAVYTSLKLTTLALVALFTGWMLVEIGVRRSLCLLGAGAAVLSGTMPVFADRLQALSIQWLPLAVALAIRWLRRHRVRDAVLFSLAAFLCVQASLYTAVMLLVVAPFLVPALWGQRRDVWRQGRALAIALAAAAALSTAVLWPYLRQRADVAAYSSAAYSALKPWSAAALRDLATSPPEYAGWPLGPAADWLGYFPGTGFVLLLGCAASLALRALLRGRGPAARGSAAPPAQSSRAFRTSKRLLGGVLFALAATLAWSGRFGPTRISAAASQALLLSALALWVLRLASWPPVRDDDRPRLAWLSSAAGLGSLVLLLLALGTPISVEEGVRPLAEGLFRPLSTVLPTVRELRELNRCLLPAGWLAVVAAVIAIERRLRDETPRAASAWAVSITAAVLGIAIAERVSADTRKASVLPVPDAYALLEASRGHGGLLELPVDPWGRILSVHRMLWQPAHGRPIVAGRTGIDPGWYVPAQQVFDEFPSEESLRLAARWGVDTVLDARPEALREWPETVVLRAERQAPARVGEVVWRVFDLRPHAGLAPEPPEPVGVWRQPHAGSAAGEKACDGRTESAATITDAAGVEFLLEEETALAVDLDYGHGLANRVPRELGVLGRTADGWTDIGGRPEFLRARVADQLLRRHSARLSIPLRPTRVSALRLVSPDVPWDLPEIRIRTSAATRSSTGTSRP